jgi:hypothetical protein
MEVVDSSETSVNFYQFSLRHIPEDRSLQHEGRVVWWHLVSMLFVGYLVIW